MANNQHKLRIAIPSSPSTSLTEASGAGPAAAAAAAAVAHQRHRTHSSELSSIRHHQKSAHGQLHSNQTGLRHAPAGPVWRRAIEYLSAPPTQTTDRWPATVRPHPSQRDGGRRPRRRAHGVARGDIGGQTRLVERTAAAAARSEREEEFPIEAKLSEEVDVEEEDEEDADEDEVDDYEDRWRTLKLAGANQQQGRNRAVQHSLAPRLADEGNVFSSRDKHFVIIDALRRRRQLRRATGEGPQNNFEPASAPAIERHLQETVPTADSSSPPATSGAPLATHELEQLNNLSLSQMGGANSIDSASSIPPAGSATSGDNSIPTTNESSDENGEEPASEEPDEHWTESSFLVQASSSPASSNDNTGEAVETCESMEAILATRPSPATGWVFGFNYTIIFVFGLMGNVITLYVLLCKGKRCSAQDILIANLACSDIMLCVFAVPITPKYLILDGHWTLGPALCKVVSFAQSTSVYMSTYSLICIGYIRYRLIVHPLEESMSKRTALFSCLGTWGVSLLVTLPYMLQVRLSPENCDIKFCDEAWEKPYLRFVFSLFTTFFQFIIPLGSVGFFNQKIYSRLDGRRLGGGGGGGGGGGSAAGAHQADHKTVLSSTASSGSSSHAGAKSGFKLAVSAEQTGGTPSQRPSHAHAHTGIQNVLAIKEQRQRDKEKRMRKANNRLIFVVVIFAHSWLPLNLFNLAQDYFEAMSNWPYLTFTFLVVHQVACSSVCWNPILYAWMSETYRQDLRIALPKFIASRLVSCLTEPASLHSTGGANSHHNANTAASNLAHSQHSLVQVNHSISASGGAGAASGFAATKAVSANSSLAPVSLPALPIAQSQTSGAVSCDELCELPSGTAPSSSCCPCSLELEARRRAARDGRDPALEIRSDTTCDEDQELCCCQLSRQRLASCATNDDERSQSSSGACQPPPPPLTNGTGRAYGDASGASKLVAIRSLSGEQASSSLASAAGPDFEQRRSSCCSMLSAGASATTTATSEPKSAQIVI